MTDEKKFEVSRPTKADGTPVDPEEAAMGHDGLTFGDIRVKAPSEIMAQLAELGFSEDDIKGLLIAAAKKAMSS